MEENKVNNLTEMQKEERELLHQQMELLAEKSKQRLSIQEIVQLSEQMTKIFIALKN